MTKPAFLDAGLAVLKHATALLLNEWMLLWLLGGLALALLFGGAAALGKDDEPQ